MRSSILKGLLNANMIPDRKFSPISFNANPITKVKSPAPAKILLVKELRPNKFKDIDITTVFRIKVMI
jgi:hypothetical protein